MNKIIISMMIVGMSFVYADSSETKFSAQEWSVHNQKSLQDALENEHFNDVHSLFKSIKRLNYFDPQCTPGMYGEGSTTEYYTECNGYKAAFSQAILDKIKAYIDMEKPLSSFLSKKEIDWFLRGEMTLLAHALHRARWKDQEKPNDRDEIIYTAARVDEDILKKMYCEHVQEFGEYQADSYHAFTAPFDEEHCFKGLVVFEDDKATGEQLYAGLQACLNKVPKNRRKLEEILAARKEIKK